MNLERFIVAQQDTYASALAEVQAGRKRTHWMWYIFPQIARLGHSETSRYYAIANRREAEAYIAHPVLGMRLIAICRALLVHTDRSALSIFGSPDDLKLRSSMTLFVSLDNADPVFQHVLDRFFGGKPDEATLRLLQNL